MIPLANKYLLIVNHVRLLFATVHQVGRGTTQDAAHTKITIRLCDLSNRISILMVSISHVFTEINGIQRLEGAHLLLCISWIDMIWLNLSLGILRVQE